MTHNGRSIACALIGFLAVVSCADDGGSFVTASVAPESSDSSVVSNTTYSVADGKVSFSLPVQVVDEREAPRFSLNADRQAEREAFLDEHVVISPYVVTLEELLREAPRMRPGVIDEILDGGHLVTTERVWQSLEKRPEGLMFDPQQSLPDSFTPIRACSTTVGFWYFSAGSGGTDGSGSYRDLLARIPRYYVAAYIDDKLVRLQLQFYSLSSDGYPVLGGLEEFFQIEDEDLFWQSADSPQAFYESLQAGELNHPKLTLFQESWEMLLSTLEFDCP